MSLLHIFWVLASQFLLSLVTCNRTSAFVSSTTSTIRHQEVNAIGLSSQKVGSTKTKLFANTGSENDNDSFRTLSQPKEIRGERYKGERSTIPTVETVASRLGVKPLKDASKETWQRAWKTQKRALPLLHSTDGCKPPDSKLNIACMWWKALSGNDKSSPVYDNGLAYDMLPSGWRKIIRPRRLYPRLHHVNVELRTAYLDSQITEIAGIVRGQHQEGGGQVNKIRLICMGAGYDTRGVRMIERKSVDQVIELDLPGVVEAKERLFQRLLKRRPWLKELSMPTLVPADFNDLADVEEKLNAILLPDDSSRDDDDDEWHTIFVFEAVMIYLDDSVPSSLLNITSRVIRENSLKGSICFADRLENVPGGDFDMGVKEMENNGWKLRDWCPKPGMARHMGSASLATSVMN